MVHFVSRLQNKKILGYFTDNIFNYAGSSDPFRSCIPLNQRPKFQVLDFSIFN